MGHKATGATAKVKVTCFWALNAKGEEVNLEADYCIVAVGRTAYTAGLGSGKHWYQTEERVVIKYL